jgi:hypothetical protein
MSTSKHTPGPWHYRQQTRAIVSTPNNDGAYVTVGHLSESAFIDDEKREANARLIAAAPELYAALQEIASAETAAGSYPGDGWRLAHEKFSAFARAILAKVQQRRDAYNTAPKAPF